MDFTTQLSLEQEFDLRAFADQVQHMSHEQVQEALLNLRRDMMIRENFYREMLKDAWGIGKENWFGGSDPLFSPS